MTAGIGERVARFRKRAADVNGKQMTVQALADRCAELGLPLGRLTITKLERGNRQAVTPAEVMVLAVALEVPPVELIFPVGQSEYVEILPGRKVPALDGLRWFSGELALDVTEAALTARAPRVGEESAGLLLEEHEAVTGRLAQMEADAAQAADIARREPGDAGRQNEASYRVVAAEYFRPAAIQSLRRIRAEMRRREMILPPVPPGLDLGEEPGYSAVDDPRTWVEDMDGFLPPAGQGDTSPRKPRRRRGSKASGEGAGEPLPPLSPSQDDAGGEHIPVPAALAELANAGGWYGNVEDPHDWVEDEDGFLPLPAEQARGATQIAGQGNAPSSRKRRRRGRPKAPEGSQAPAADASGPLPLLPPSELAWRNRGDDDGSR